MAGAASELARKALVRDFHNIDPGDARIVLVEAAARLLGTFSEKSSAFAKRALEELDVSVRLGVAVTACDDAGVIVGGERIEACTIIWAAGVAASAAAKWISAEKDRAGRIKVEPDLSVPGHSEIFAIGDTALAVDPHGTPLPSVAPVAKQQGAYIGKIIRARVSGRSLPGAFSYRNYGNLATIGRKSAIAEFGRIRIYGFPAWLLWSVAHIYFLIGFRSRFSVALNWAWAYLTFQRGARLITGEEG
jgi:NADH dehydrogenase